MESRWRETNNGSFMLIQGIDDIESFVSLFNDLSNPTEVSATTTNVSAPTHEISKAISLCLPQMPFHDTMDTSTAFSNKQTLPHSTQACILTPSEPAMPELNLKYDSSVWNDEEEWMIETTEPQATKMDEPLELEDFHELTRVHSNPEHPDVESETESNHSSDSSIIGEDIARLEALVDSIWDHRDMITRDEPDIHHWNWAGDPVYEPSATSPMESLVALKSQKWRDPANSPLKISIYNRAVPLVDPIMTYSSEVRKFYSHHGRWSEDKSLESNEVFEDEKDRFTYLHPDIEVSTGFWESGSLVYQCSESEQVSGERFFSRKPGVRAIQPSKLKQSHLACTENQPCKGNELEPGSPQPESTESRSPIEGIALPRDEHNVPVVEEITTSSTKRRPVLSIKEKIPLTELGSLLDSQTLPTKPSHMECIDPSPGGTTLIESSMDHSQARMTQEDSDNLQNGDLLETGAAKQVGANANVEVLLPSSMLNQRLSNETEVSGRSKRVQIKRYMMHIASKALRKCENIRALAFRKRKKGWWSTKGKEGDNERAIMRESTI